MIDLFEEEEEVILHALEWTTKVHIAFAKAQLEAGAVITSMGDAYASPNLISPNLYNTFALPFEKKTVKEVQTGDKLYSIHICGDTSKIIEDMATTGAKVLEVDAMLDMKKARNIVPESTTLMGNIDPSGILYLGTREDIEGSVKNLVEATEGKGLIISSGCAIGANVPADNMRTFIKAARKYGSYENVMRLQGK